IAGAPKHIDRVRQVHDPIANVPDPAHAVTDAVSIDDVPREAAVVDRNREGRVAEIAEWPGDCPGHTRDLAEDPVDLEVGAHGGEVVGPHVVEKACARRLRWSGDDITL